MSDRIKSLEERVSELEKEVSQLKRILKKYVKDKDFPFPSKPTPPDFPFKEPDHPDLGPPKK